MDKGLNIYHLTTLSFKNKAWETLFSAHYFRENLFHGRLCHIVAILFYTGDGIRDFMLFPEHLTELSIIRYGVAVPMFSVGLVFSYLKPDLYEKLWQFLFAFYFFVAGVGALLIAHIIPQPTGSLLYVGLIYCLVFGYTFIRLRFIWATLVGLLLTSGYLVSVLAWTPHDSTVTWIQLPYVLGVNILGMFVAYTLEFNFRRHFLLHERYKEQNKELDRLNRNLEHRVEERTAALAAANQSLKQNMADLKSSEAERNKLEAQLRQTYKMEAIGTLAGGIAHDFNNILTSILGYTELAMEDAPEEGDMSASLREVYRAGRRARDLVRQILAFARQSDEVRKPVQVSPIAREVLQLLRSSIPSNIEIVSEINSELFITGDPINVHQVLMNLCTNASHAMDGGGTLTVSLSDISLPDEALTYPDSLKPGNHVMLRVSDTGTGIPSDILDSIFEPYFTTKGPGEGTGMGLAMVYGIIKNYEGDIQVESKRGKGTTFTVYFPGSRRGEHTVAYEPEDLPRGDERILFVDDEPAIAKMNSLMLKRLGYTVTSRVSSMDALELFQTKPDDFDLVITDMMMPNMTGDRLAAELKRIRPGIPVIMCTGYTKTVTLDAVSAIGIKALVHKPVIKADLARAIRKALDTV